MFPCWHGISQTLLQDVAVFAVMQAAEICIMQVFLKELDYAGLRFSFAVANVGHYYTIFLLLIEVWELFI